MYAYTYIAFKCCVNFIHSSDQNKLTLFPNIYIYYLFYFFYVPCSSELNMLGEESYKKKTLL